jgi:hypothetical protein
MLPWRLYSFPDVRKGLWKLRGSLLAATRFRAANAFLNVREAQLPADVQEAGRAAEHKEVPHVVC